MHPFEKAGLGEAPFTFVGVVIRQGPIRSVTKEGITVEVGSPGQPMGTCRYCSQGIKECCIIRDAHGAQFEVGNTCVYKTDDEPMVKETKKAINKSRRERRQQREADRIAAARTYMDNHPEVGAQLGDRPHPAIEGKTMLDYVEWMLAHAGRAGKLKVARAIEGLMPAQAAP